MWQRKLDLKSSALRDRNRETATKRARKRQRQGHKVLEGHRWVYFRAACSSASERKEKKHGSKLLMLQQRALWLPRGEREKDLNTNLRLGFELRARYLLGGKLFSSQKEFASNFVLLGGSLLLLLIRSSGSAKENSSWVLAFGSSCFVSSGEEEGEIRKKDGASIVADQSRTGECH